MPNSNGEANGRAAGRPTGSSTMPAKMDYGRSIKEQGVEYILRSFLICCQLTATSVSQLEREGPEPSENTCTQIDTHIHPHIQAGSGALDRPLARGNKKQSCWVCFDTTYQCRYPIPPRSARKHENFLCVRIVLPATPSFDWSINNKKEKQTSK